MLLLVFAFSLPSQPSYAFPQTQSECLELSGLWNPPPNTGCYLPVTYGATQSALQIPPLIELVKLFRGSVILSIYPTLWTLVIVRKIYFV